IRGEIGGEGGIRTLGTLSSTHDFQSCTFDHSVTPPCTGNPCYPPVEGEDERPRGGAGSNAISDIAHGQVIVWLSFRCFDRGQFLERVENLQPGPAEILFVT